MVVKKVAHNHGIWHLLAGIIMVVAGIYVWFHPAETLLALAMYLGIIFIVVGAGYFAASFTYNSGWYLLVGVLDILVGIIFVGNLGVTAVSLPIIFALWCLAIGAVQLVFAYEFHKIGITSSWAAIAGLLGIAFAFLIISYPGVGAITITVLMGLYLFLYGAVEIAEYAYGRKMLARLG